MLELRIVPGANLKLIEETEGTAALYVPKMDKGEEVIESKRFKSFLFSRQP